MMIKKTFRKITTQNHPKKSWEQIFDAKGFMKKGKHHSNSSEENENVDLPGKDPITDVETPQKGKTESCDWPYYDAEESENSEDLAFSGHYKCTKRNEEKQNEEKK